MRFCASFLLMLSLSLAIFAQKPTITIGIVADGPSPVFSEEWLPLFKAEIKDLLDRDYDVQFPDAFMLMGNWKSPEIVANFDKLLANEEVDLVLCLGLLATLEAASRPEGYDKPVIGPFGISSDLPVYPFKDGTSGVRNFNYIVSPSSLARDVAVIRQIKDVEVIHFISYNQIPLQVPGLQQWVLDTFTDNGFKVEFLVSQASVEDTLASLPQGIELLYVAPLLRMTQDQKRAFYDGLRERGIASFSMLGREEVELGALVGLQPASDNLRWARRVALNVQRAIFGEDLGSLPVILENRQKTTINMRTGRAIDWYPSWDLQNTADLLFQEPENVDRKLTLSEAVKLAISANLDLKANELEVQAGAREIELAKADRRPQLEFDLNGLRVDDDTAAASSGAQAETTVTGSATLQQVIFSDGINANIQIQKVLQELRLQERRTLELDVALDTAVAFLEYLKARTQVRIQRNNLDLTNANLETARLRVKVGTTGRSDVFRWESEFAQDRAELIAAEAQAESALAVLNQLIDAPQESLLEAVEPDLFDPNLMTGRGQLGQYVDNERDFRIVRDFLVTEGLIKAPELKQFDLLIQAKQLELNAAQRDRYMPTVAFQAGLDHRISESGLTPLDLSALGITTAERKDTGWNAALSVSYKLFTGQARKARINQDTFELENLRVQREATSQKIELNIRTSLQLVGARSAGIDLSEVAAKAARDNYDLVEDSYAKGVASVITLLDAQNSALVAEQNAADVVYDFFIDLMRYQRAAANFDFFFTQAERAEFFQRLEQSFQRARQ